jgi:hypothetical protein
LLTPPFLALARPAFDLPTPGFDFQRGNRRKGVRKRTFFRSRKMTQLAIEKPWGHEEQLESQLLRRLGGRMRDLRIILRHNGLILQGRSGTYHAKQLAQHAAMELTGLPVLANDIEVR